VAVAAPPRETLKEIVLDLVAEPAAHRLDGVRSGIRIEQDVADVLPEVVVAGVEPGGQGGGGRGGRRPEKVDTGGFLAARGFDYAIVPAEERGDVGMRVGARTGAIATLAGGLVVILGASQAVNALVSRSVEAGGEDGMRAASSGKTS